MNTQSTATQHTPGPWIDAGHGALLHPVTNSPVTTTVIEAKDFGRILEVYDYSNEPDGNFRLIVAAPELLAIARAYRAALNSSDSEHPDFLDSGADTIALLWSLEKEVRAVLAKLEGRT